MPLITALLVAAWIPAARAASEGALIERQDWPFAGAAGQFDQAQLQRGFQVYSQVCAGCHGLERVSFRNLAEPGGPEFPEDAVKGLAASWPNKPKDVPNDNGELVERVPLPSDPILGPYRTEPQARASQPGGALPPDLSLIVKARGVEASAPFYAHPFVMLSDMATGYQEGGADYLHALLTGYGQPPFHVRTGGGELIPLAPGTSEASAARCASITHPNNGEPDVCVPLMNGMHYNAAFPGHQIAMPPPLSKENFVKYQDGSGSLDGNARDVTAFLAWAADPNLDQRKRIGWQVMIYLLITTVLLYLMKTRLWRKVH